MGEQALLADRGSDGPALPVLPEVPWQAAA